MVAALVVVVVVVVVAVVGRSEACIALDAVNRFCN